eukprot:IDg3414t1
MATSNNISYSGMTLHSSENIEVTNNDLDAIIDVGATASVIGWKKYITLCDEIGTKPIVLDLRNTDLQYHAFGKYRSSLRDIIARRIRSGLLLMRTKLGVLKIKTITTSADQHARIPISGIKARENLVASMVSESNNMNDGTEMDNKECSGTNSARLQRMHKIRIFRACRVEEQILKRHFESLRSAMDAASWLSK